ncbi:Water stress and hypersensitive response domain-containing protein [Natrarchaeobaculum aegyptiacum]|uniref:Water stress and hypersensitive response domain-containing protein n=1 Tax=Natrarchaeobaculum aegyptiacum TaxID=745377 RepID=A0A2Z2HXP0_9EURY|nr:Water stress and hypersensitive response domain-containing protein [Natrarchaeobaculum aegyptiacum]ARS89744.1 Water stress and hypersensitive response domain-containing protein [Natrarchaeobaculum aegyptiacum]
MFGKVLKVILVLGVCTAVGLGGLFATGALGVPDAGIEDNAWGEVDDDRIEVVTTVWVDNPNPGLEVDDLTLEYALWMNDVDLADGTAADVGMPAGNTTTEIRSDLRYQHLSDWWVAHVESDEVSDLRADVTAHVEWGPLSGAPSYTHEDEVETDLEPMIADSMAQLEGEHSLSPVEGGGALEPTVEIRDTDAEWGEVDENRTELHLTYEVHNPNAYPLPTPALTGEMEFNDHLVGEWDAHEVEVLHGGYDATIPPGESREITFVVDLDNDDVVQWFATHVDGEEVTDAELRAQLAMNVDGQTMTIPGDEEAIHCEYDLRTDIFVDQESGIEQTGCELLPWATPDQEEFDELEATLELDDALLAGDGDDGERDEGDDADDSDEADDDTTGDDAGGGEIGGTDSLLGTVD